ncbi:venom metalloproteinase antarease TserMP_A-like isoform X1 [Dermacentor andersoni]|uniref:venom metalloproteinase antarease TserMP_A-like isoform X1 n=2 Tax=Dermacentor andersoni TaxID=34620 RepID=UPI002417A24A|nr:venom metalloproteinase antarease TserMP_A-like isoform X1 [Dermacentor andersoni]
MLALIVLLRLAACSYADKELFVYPTILEGRTTVKNLVMRLTEDITLNLKKSSVLAETLLFVTSSKESTQLEAVNTTSIQEDLYHDTHHQSSVMVHQRDGTVQVEGILNSNLRIKPLPEGERSLQGQVLHKLYEVQETKANFKDSVKHTGTYQGKEYEAYRNRKERTTFDTFVLEVHVISDQAHNKHFGENEDLISYLAIMANAANLRYLDMKNPAIKIRLVGITRSKHESFAVHNEGTLDADKTLDSLVEYYSKGNIPGNPDVVYFITGQDLSGVEDGKLDTTFTGLAYTGRLCTTQGVAEGEDIATSYSGTRTMAHELAHTMGASHDKTPRCPWEEGYLMSYADGGTRKYTLSPCSRDSIRSTMQKVSRRCVSVLSSKNYMARYKFYPGQKMSDLYYCRTIMRQPNKDIGIIAKKPLELSMKCKMECCTKIYKKVNCTVVDILEGMRCSSRKTCRRGVCAIHEWL